MPAVSVVVPVYNVEKYLRQCLDSVCNQTFRDLEILCVDDGSTDSSLDIIKEFASKDERFRIITQENKGPSAARNIGIDNAEGKYVYCMDSDDYLEKEAIEELYNIAEENSLDCIMFKLIKVNDETGEKYPSRYYDMAFVKDMVGDRVFSHEDIGGDLFFIPVSPQGKFFNREFLNDIRFEEGIIFEDNPFFAEVLLKADRLYFYDKYLCNRRVRSGSLMTSKKNFTDYIIVSNRMIDLSKRYGVYEQYKPQLHEKIFKNLFIRFSEVEEENKQEFFEKLQKDFLSKKDEYDADEIFQNGDERLKEIFYKCLDAKTPKEFELYIELFDTEAKLEKAIEQKNQLNREKQSLFHRSYDLSRKVNMLANENRMLKDE